MSVTTTKVSRETLEMLRRFKERVGVRSYDEAIQLLLREYRARLLEKYFGVDRGRITSFTEEDRVEDRELERCRP